MIFPSSMNEAAEFRHKEHEDYLKEQEDQIWEDASRAASYIPNKKISFSLQALILIMKEIPDEFADDMLHALGGASFTPSGDPIYGIAPSPNDHLYCYTMAKIAAWGVP